MKRKLIFGLAVAFMTGCFTGEAPSDYELGTVAEEVPLAKGAEFVSLQIETADGELLTVDAETNRFVALTNQATYKTTEVMVSTFGDTPQLELHHVDKDAPSLAGDCFDAVNEQPDGLTMPNGDQISVLGVPETASVSAGCCIRCGPSTWICGNYVCACGYCCYPQ